MFASTKVEIVYVVEIFRSVIKVWLIKFVSETNIFKRLTQESRCFGIKKWVLDYKRRLLAPALVPYFGAKMTGRSSKIWISANYAEHHRIALECLSNIKRRKLNWFWEILAKTHTHTHTHTYTHTHTHIYIYIYLYISNFILFLWVFSNIYIYIYILMDSFIRTWQCWSTKKNLSSTALYGHMMSSWRPIRNDGWKRQMMRVSHRSLCTQRDMIYIYIFFFKKKQKPVTLGL